MANHPSQGMPLMELMGINGEQYSCRKLGIKPNIFLVGTSPPWQAAKLGKQRGKDFCETEIRRGEIQIKYISEMGVKGPSFIIYVLLLKNVIL